MQTETQAPEIYTTAAPLVDLNAPPAAPASAPADDASVDTPITAPETDDSSTQQEQDRNDKGQFKSGAQKRIDALVFQRHQAEREAAYWKSQAQSVQAPSPAPRLADFETHDEFDQAMLQHRIDTGVNQGLARTAEQHATKFSTDAQNAAADAYQQRVTDVATRIPDFAAVVSKSDVAMSPELRDALMDSEKGPELVYHLAKNPAEAARLNAMSVRQMDREIGRLETSISTKVSAPPPPAARTTSAPPPIKPGSPASAPGSTDPAKMSQGEFEAWARANGSRYIR